MDLSRRDFFKRIGLAFGSLAIVSAVGNKLGFMKGAVSADAPNKEFTVADLVRGRAVIDAYRKKHDASTRDFSYQLQDQIEQAGFNSVDHFFAVNRDMITKDMARCIRFEGECDFCKDKPKHMCADVCWNGRMQGGKVKYQPDLVKNGPNMLFTGMRYHYPNTVAEGAPRTDLIGKKTAILPGCKVNVVYIASPSIKWGWK